VPPGPEPAGRSSRTVGLTRDATTRNRSRRTCSTGTLSPLRRTGYGSPTSPTSRPIRDGSTWPLSWTCGDERSFAHRTAAGSLEDGHLDAAAWRRPHPPFLSGRSICLGVPEGDAVRWLPGLDEWQGRLLPQCPDGEFLPHTQNRTGPPPEYATRAEATRDILPTLRASTTEAVVTPPSAVSARSRWS
jgi:hypothetical protein